MSINRILFVTGEAHPLVKTGGLGDVSGSLPGALRSLRRDVRIMLPAYRAALERAGEVRTGAEFAVPGYPAPLRLLEAHLPGTKVPVWLVDAPPLFDRPGNPYTDTQGRDWPDNALRFTVLARAAEAVALDRAGLSWLPDVVHCNDWQSGLVPALLAGAARRPACVFTIHNLAYQGLFPWEEFQRLGLPAALWSMHGMEFYGRFSFIKGGITYSDMVSTVSPAYAREIRTPAYGCGLEDLLAARADRLVGILNGADYQQWNPAKDPFLAQRYNAHTWRAKVGNKLALQRDLDLPQSAETPLIGLIGRLVEQKGFDLLLEIVPRLMHRPLQIAVLGSGERSLEQELRAAVARHPQRIAAHVGYSEELAHRIEGGADMFVMPSRYEPCGLNQIYSLRYGTIPVVRRTGGLADTVIDATAETVRTGTATGFVFDDPTPAALLDALGRALECYGRPRTWKKLAYNGMQQDFSWRQSAKHYLALYQRAGEIAAAGPR